jgi:hypothetical protein
MQPITREDDRSAIVCWRTCGITPRSSARFVRALRDIPVEDSALIGVARDSMTTSLEQSHSDPALSLYDPRRSRRSSGHKQRATGHAIT